MTGPIRINAFVVDDVVKVLRSSDDTSIVLVLEDEQGDHCGLALSKHMADLIVAAIKEARLRPEIRVMTH